MTDHPSFLDLDRLALGDSDPRVAAHVEDCATCQEQVFRVRQPAPMQPWVAAIGARSRRRRTWWLGAIAGVASVASVVAINARRPADDRGAKGIPSVALYVKRGEAVTLWDGHAAFAPGDALRIKISPQGFQRVAVAAVQGDTVTELYAESLSARGESVLPPSWTLDATPGPDALLLVFSHAPLSEEALRRAAAQLPRTNDVWATRLTLEKIGGDR